MADIKECLESISSAIYGRDVRASIHDSISAINDEVEGYAEAEESRASAEKERQEAEEARKETDAKLADAEKARATAEEGRAAAEQKRDEAEEAREKRIDDLVEATGAERVHVCADGEYADADDGTRAPSLEKPTAGTLYLVPIAEPQGERSYSPWLYVAGKWEDIGGGKVPVPVAEGGTGATSAEAARESLSVYSKDEVDALVAKGSDSETAGTPILTGSSFTNLVGASVTEIVEGTLSSKVTLAIGSSNTAVAIIPNSGLEQMGAKVGSVLGMAFDERDVSIVSSAAIAPSYNENIWSGTVNDFDADTVEERVEIDALGTTVYAIISKSVGNAMGLNETSAVKLMISPFDIHLLPLSRQHTGGTNTPD